MFFLFFFFFDLFAGFLSFAASTAAVAASGAASCTLGAAGGRRDISHAFEGFDLVTILAVPVWFQAWYHALHWRSGPSIASSQQATAAWQHWAAILPSFIIRFLPPPLINEPFTTITSLKLSSPLSAIACSKAFTFCSFVLDLSLRDLFFGSSSSFLSGSSSAFVSLLHSCISEPAALFE